MSVEPYKKLVKLVARSFYDDMNLKGDTKCKSTRGDNRGMAIVILDALTRRQWVREEDLANHLKINLKQLRCAMEYFKKEKLVTRYNKTAMRTKKTTAEVAASSDGQVRAGVLLNQHTQSYCCLNYAQIHDVVRYRMHHMKKKLKDELENRNTVQGYICPICRRRYTTLDALSLVSSNDFSFHCENCNAILVTESERLAADQMGDGDASTRSRRHDKLKDILLKMDVQLKPLNEQLDIIKHLPPPEFESLQAWEARSTAAICANDDSNANHSSIPYLGEMEIEVVLSGVTEVGTNATEAPSDRQVGMKSKREYDIESEEAPTEVGTSHVTKQNDLNGKADPSDDFEDEGEWEETMFR